MKHIHLQCLKQWLNSKRTQRQSSQIATYCWKQVECELCKLRLPFQIQHHERTLDLLDYEKPSKPYYILESVTAQNLKIVHVISKHIVAVGRGLENEIRITDISVSRDHALIRWSRDGNIYVQDLLSKFGSAVQV
jgi:hypothetical protein